jgi:hypothetical protein
MVAHVQSFVYSYAKRMFVFPKAPLPTSTLNKLTRGIVKQVLSKAAVQVEEYLGHAIVFVIMADVWYDKLYQHNVLGNTVSDVGVVSQLDKIMDGIMLLASGSVKADAAAAVARATFTALETTLLHGGVFRNFSSEDADLLRRDCHELQVCAPWCSSRRLLSLKEIPLLMNHKL